MGIITTITTGIITIIIKIKRTLSCKIASFFVVSIVNERLPLKGKAEYVQCSICWDYCAIILLFLVMIL